MPTTEEIELLRRKEAAARSHQNAKLVDDYATTLMSSMLTINGTAITAILVALGTEKVFKSAFGNMLCVLALVFFGAGIVSSLSAVLLQRMNVAKWRDIWEARVYGPLDGGIAYKDLWGDRAVYALWLSIGLFLLGVLTIALAIFNRG